MSQSIKLPKLLQEGCVLQRGEKTRIWGWYKPQAELEVTFQEKVYRAKCKEDGAFETEVSCEKTGGPYVLSVKSEDGQETVVKEVSVGDVFVCSGQSNMELPITREKLEAAAKKLLEDDSYGHIFRIKGFLEEEGSWIELNATHRSFTVSPIPCGQSVLIVIGEGLLKERIKQLFTE